MTYKWTPPDLDKQTRLWATEAGPWAYCTRTTACGHWCGYVGVSRLHLAFGKDENDLDIDVHGGITWARNCLPNLDFLDLWWIGFDCGHSQDLSPSLGPMMANQVYRDYNYVVAECESLAKQLMDL